MPRLAVLTLFTLTLAVTACGGGASKANPADKYVCSIPAESACVELSGSFSSSQISQLTSACQSYGGTVSTGTCPDSVGTASIVGICSDPADASYPAGTSVQILFYQPASVTFAQAECESESGTWQSSGSGDTATACELLTWNESGNVIGSTCLEISGSFASSDIAALSTLCQGEGGAFAASACPSAFNGGGQIGACTGLDLSSLFKNVAVSLPGVPFQVIYYQPDSAEGAQYTCGVGGFNGTWQSITPAASTATTSCNLGTTTNTCIEVSGVFAQSDISALSSYCVGQGGLFSATGACPATLNGFGQIGTCSSFAPSALVDTADSLPGGTFQVIYYEPNTSQASEYECGVGGLKGVWQSG